MSTEEKMKHEISKGKIYAQLAWLFFKMGVTAFGGPAAHIAVMEREVVEKRKWVTRDHFLDLVGATNLIPGPNSTEMAIHIGYIMGGWLGLLIAGFCFIVPAVILTIFFAWLYVLGITSYGDIMESILFGIIPVVLAIIIGAIWRLGKKAAKSVELIILGIVVIPFAIFFPNQTIFVLLGGGIVGMSVLLFIKAFKRKTNQKSVQNDTINQESQPKLNKKRLIISAIIAAILWGGFALTLWLLSLGNSSSNPGYIDIMWFFYSVGSILYGSGYVLFAYLEGDLVGEYGWLSDSELSTSIALGQFTPGPVLSTSAAVGFILANNYGLLGIPAAILAVIGIFLPSFLVVVILNPVVKQARKWKWAAAFLDAVNISAVAVMIVVTGRLGYNFFVISPQVLPLEPLGVWRVLVAIILMGSATLVLVKWKKINSAFIVLSGALIGGLIHWFLL